MPLSRRNFIQNAVLGISAAGLSAAPALAKNISSSTAHIISKTSGHADTSTSKSLHIISLDRLETSAKRCDDGSCVCIYCSWCWR